MSGLWWRWVTGEWRRHRGLMLWLLLGLINAAALLSAIEVLNRSARTSFADASAQTEQPRPWRIQSAISGHRIDIDLWLSLRRAGIDAEPMLEGQALLDNGDWLRLHNPGTSTLAIDGDWALLADRKLAERRGWDAGQQLVLASGDRLPPLTLIDDLGPFLLLDLAPLSRVLESGDFLTYLTLPELTDAQRSLIERLLPPHLNLTAKHDPAQDSLLAALNLNLTALSVLAFLVALLLAFHAFERLLQKRQRAHRVMHQLGITRRGYLVVLLMEWTALALLCGVIGSMLGVELAKLLAPGLGDTLVNLYGLRQNLSVYWTPWQALEAAVLLWTSMLVMGAWLLWRPRSRWGRWITPLVMAATALLWWQSDTGWQALLVCGLTVLSLLLLAPGLMALVQRLLGRFSLSMWPGEAATLLWAVSDQAAQRRHLSLAAMAITLALAMAVSTRVMVGSFEQALVDHLNQRLFADHYIGGSEPSLKTWQKQLAALPPEVYVETIGSRDAELGDMPIRLVVHEPGGTPWPFVHLKEAGNDWWGQLGQGGCIANEPLALKLGLELGEVLQVNSGQGNMACRLAAIQYDYGNPAGHLVLQRQVVEASLGTVPLEGLAVTTPGNPDWVRQRLSEMGIPDGAIRPQGDIRQLALTLFSRTFVITDALASLTLLVAFVSWLASVASASRLWRHDHGVLLALGCTPRQLILARLWQLFALLVAILLIGVLGGQVLGYQLLSLVNPLSFGWTMAVNPLSGHWWPYLAAALFGGLLLALWPAARELKTPAASMIATEGV
ncbi:FtsX-like permease family protein [Ferrimonas balearica]|uniref:FtsX-like permease family protein n=1 Tax=Ferrimonas balearica TaxID=44012 RepID=UPI001C96E44C|nr:FtsX-like permease family protein [Ferrimonas balearica]MBY6106094.1 FtsX-like permease family protein [Ferrimonas balearica]